MVRVPVDEDTDSAKECQLCILVQAPAEVYVWVCGPDAAGVWDDVHDSC